MRYGCDVLTLKGVSMRCCILGICLYITVLACNAVVAAESGKPFVILGTSGVTGVYYAAGHAVAKVFKRSDIESDFRIDAESSSGSIENIDKVLSGEWALGIAQADILYEALKGEGIWKGKPVMDLRALSVLHSETMTIIVAANQGIDSVYDLKGRTIGIGSSDSSDSYIFQNILTLYGLDLEKDLQLKEVPAIEAPELLQKGSLDGYVYTVGHPNLALYESSFGNRTMKLLSLEPYVIDHISKTLPYLTRVDIPMIFYQEFENIEPVETIGVKAVLFTSVKVPGYQISAILNALLDDFPRFQRQHPAFAELSRIDLPHGTIVPLHPAAYQLYKEKRILQ